MCIFACNSRKEVIPLVCIALPKSGNKVAGSGITATQELSSNNTMQLRSDAAIAAFPDSAVMARTSDKAPPFAEQRLPFPTTQNNNGD